MPTPQSDPFSFLNDQQREFVQAFIRELVKQANADLQASLRGLFAEQQRQVLQISQQAAGAGGGRRLASAPPGVPIDAPVYVVMRRSEDGKFAPVQTTIPQLLAEMCERQIDMNSLLNELVEEVEPTPAPRSRRRR